MFKALKMKHSRLDELVANHVFPDGSTRKVNMPAYKCMSTKDWVLVWDMKTRSQAIADYEERFPSGKIGSITISQAYSRDGQLKHQLPKLHIDELFETFVTYFGAQDRPAREWRDAMRTDSNRLRSLKMRMSEILRGRQDWRDKYRKFLVTPAAVLSPLERIVANNRMFGKMLPSRLPSGRIPLSPNVFPRGMEGGLKRGEMFAFSGHNPGPHAHHLRMAMAARERGLPLLRISLEDSIVGKELTDRFNNAIMADLMVTGADIGGFDAVKSHSFDFPLLVQRSQEQDYAIDWYPNASPMLQMNEELERLGMMHKGLIPYPSMVIDPDIKPFGVPINTAFMQMPEPQESAVVISQEQADVAGVYPDKLAIGHVSEETLKAALKPHQKAVRRYYTELIDNTVPPSINLSFKDHNIKDTFPNVEEELEKKFGTLKPTLDDSKE